MKYCAHDERCQTIVMGHQCASRKNHSGKCAFHDSYGKPWVPPSERKRPTRNERITAIHLRGDRCTETFFGKPSKEGAK